jgi:hypothetical protein
VSTVATPQEKAGGKPIVALPNPFYQAYLGGAVLSGAEPLLVNAHAGNGFLPDYLSLDRATWDRIAVVYLCSPANPQGAIADIPYLQKLLAKCREHDVVLAVDERPAARTRSAISRCSTRCPSARMPPACAPASWRAIRAWWR